MYICVYVCVHNWGKSGASIKYQWQLRWWIGFWGEGVGEGKRKEKEVSPTTNTIPAHHVT